MKRKTVVLSALLITIFFSTKLSAQYGGRGESWKIKDLPKNQIDSIYNELLDISDSLEKHFFTLSPPYNEYMFFYLNPFDHQRRIIFKLYLYKKDSAQGYTVISNNPFQKEGHEFITETPVTLRFDKKLDKRNYNRHQKMLSIDQKLENGKWLQRSLGNLNDNITNEDSIVLVTRRVHGKLDILVVGISLGKYFLYSEDNNAYPSPMLEMWSSFF